MNKVYKVYLITNTITGLCYVGWTGKPMKIRMGKHFSDSRTKNGRRRYFYRAILEHGRDCWRVRILWSDTDLQEVRNAEQVFIEKYDTHRNGYNANGGGG